MYTSIKKNRQTGVLLCVIKPFFIDKMALIGGTSPSKEEFAVILPEKCLKYCVDDKKISFSLCFDYAVILTLSGVVLIDTFDVIGQGKNILSIDWIPRCTCGSWAVNTNKHSDYCSIRTDFLPFYK
jgi:hypothetical protein